MSFVVRINAATEAESSISPIESTGKNAGIRTPVWCWQETTCSHPSCCALASAVSCTETISILIAQASPQRPATHQVAHDAFTLHAAAQLLDLPTSTHKCQPAIGSNVLQSQRVAAFSRQHHSPAAQWPRPRCHRPWCSICSSSGYLTHPVQINIFIYRLSEDPPNCELPQLEFHDAQACADQQW